MDTQTTGGHRPTGRTKQAQGEKAVICEPGGRPPEKLNLPTLNTIINLKMRLNNLTFSR